MTKSPVIGSGVVWAVLVAASGWAAACAADQDSLLADTAGSTKADHHSSTTEEPPIACMPENQAPIPWGIGWPYREGCGPQMAAIFSTPVSSDTSFTIARSDRCTLRGLERRCVDYFFGFWNVEMSEPFDETEYASFGIRTRKYGDKGTVVDVGINHEEFDHGLTCVWDAADELVMTVSHDPGGSGAHWLCDDYETRERFDDCAVDLISEDNTDEWTFIHDGRFACERHSP